MKIDDLKESAGLEIWDSKESELVYSYPLPYNRETAQTGQISTEEIPANQLYKVGIFFAAKSPESHIGPFKWAIDFLVADKTQVLATQDGKILEIQEKSKKWGDSPEFRDYLNYLTIQHESGEYSQYCHLAYMFAEKIGLKVGDQVKKGQPVGIVGKTGWTDRDHLHFVVFKDDKSPQNPYGFKSLKIRWSHE